MTAIGKIFKPALRVEAARRLVEMMLVELSEQCPEASGLLFHAREMPGGRIAVDLESGNGRICPADLRKTLSDHLDCFLFEWTLDGSPPDEVRISRIGD
jgi:hypothetical protein